MPPAPDRSPARLRAWLPRGAALADPDWQWRHRAVCGGLAVHVPALGTWAGLTGRADLLWAVAVPLLALVVAATPWLDRRGRSLVATAGLLTCSALVVQLADGATQASFHSFLVVAVIALYQDWAAYALAVGAVLLQHGVGTGAGDWRAAAVHAAFVLAQSAVLVLFWRAHEQSRATEDRLRAELALGRESVQARLAEADRMRADLIGTVSHEFRTPLTGIRGAALTLLKRGDRLDGAARDSLLHAVLDQQERLSRLLENMLLASEATSVDPTASAEVDAVAAEVAMLAAAHRRGPAVSVVVEPGTTARIDRQALHQVLANLLDNALQHGVAGSTPLVAGGHDEHGVWLTVSNEGRTINLTEAGRLFEPFTQASTGATRDREGIGVGLYVVRRLVEVYGGAVHVRSDDGWVTVEVRLLAAAAPARTASLAG